MSDASIDETDISHQVLFNTVGIIVASILVSAALVTGVPPFTGHKVLMWCYVLGCAVIGIFSFYWALHIAKHTTSLVIGIIVSICTLWIIFNALFAVWSALVWQFWSSFESR